MIITGVCLLLTVALIIVFVRAIRARLANPAVIVEFSLLGGALCLMTSILCGFANARACITVATAVEGFALLGLAGFVALSLRRDR